ncbi:MAG TPA: FecR family protein [Candidatus Acidoferrales bacterium]|nr:FecR family protein [Candidatus Acidoferrales bacterium]
MTWPHRWCAVAIFAALALGSTAPCAADDKSLQNVKGSVSYQAPNAPAVPIVVNATIALADADYAITGAESLAALNLPDSSQVLLGSQSKVQLALFNVASAANAQFVVYGGKVRFAVRHPHGAKANYTFTTPTATVGVRGTQGDISFDPDGALRVNVYELCDPDAPVVVTTKDGTPYTLNAGQSLFAQISDGIVHAEVMQVTQDLIDQFSPDFGVPTSWDQAKGEVIDYAQAQAQNAAGDLGGQAVGALGGLLGGHKPSAPKASTC